MITQNELLSLQKRLSKNADKKAFRKLFDNLSPKLCRFACQYVTVEEAEEVVNLVLIRLWKNRKEIIKISNLTIYLYKAVRFEVIKVNKRKSRVNLVVLDKDTEQANPEYFCSLISPDEILAAKELHHFLNKQVEQLSPKSRLAFKLVKEDGMKYAEAAKVIGVSKNTVENHVATALKILKKAIIVYQQGDVKSKKNISPKQILSFFLFFFCI